MYEYRMRCSGVRVVVAFVLSVLLLPIGVPPVQAQIGMDPRCADFTGQAMELCTAAALAGCFDGVVSQECAALLNNWMNTCALCAGFAPPWEEGSCPCAVEGRAVELNDFFESQAFDIGPVTSICNELGQVLVIRNDGATIADAPGLIVGVIDDVCQYALLEAQGFLLVDQLHSGMSAVESEACAEDIRTLIDQLIDCP